MRINHFNFVSPQVSSFTKNIVTSFSTAQKILFGVISCIAFACLAIFVAKRCFKSKHKSVIKKGQTPPKKELQDQRKKILPAHTANKQELKNSQKLPTKFEEKTEETAPLNSPNQKEEKIEELDLSLKTSDRPLEDKKVSFNQLKTTLLSPEEIKTIKEETKGSVQELEILRDFFNYFGLSKKSAIFKENLKNFLSSLSEEELRTLANKKVDIFDLYRSSLSSLEGFAFILNNLDDKQTRALFEGIFNGELPDKWTLIHCIDGINSPFNQKDKNLLFDQLLAVIYTSFRNKNDKEGLKEYLDISSYREAGSESSRTQALIAFTQSSILTALKQETEKGTENILDVLDTPDGLLMMHCLKELLLKTLSLEQQIKLKIWSDKHQSRYIYSTIIFRQILSSIKEHFTDFNLNTTKDDIKKNLNLIIASLDEKEIDQLTSKESDIFHIDRASAQHVERIAFVCDTLDDKKTGLFFRGLFKEADPSPWTFIHCIEAINSSLHKKDKSRLCSHLLANLYFSPRFNKENLKKYLELSFSCIDHKKPNSLQTQAFIAFIENNISIALTLKNKLIQEHLLEILKETNKLFMNVVE